MHLFWHFFQRDFKSRYLGSLSGLLWAVVHPALQLLMYATVFEQIFKARIPGAEAHGFVAYVGVAFWAWTLYADAASRAVGSIVENAALIGKVAVSPVLLVCSAVAATAALHLVGYAAALTLLAITGSSIHGLGVLLAIPVYGLLLMLTLGVSLMLSAVQVFVRDLAQVWTQMLAFWFFLTPVLYSRAMLPEFAQDLMRWNPLTYYPERLRVLILEGEYALTMADAHALIVALCALGLGVLVFQRLRRHFEDFL
ncbi:MAG: ABC transporter permease [Lysobacterales bacterium]